jgi:branched-chain amino acid transport system ATP-binding protein
LAVEAATPATAAGDGRTAPILEIRQLEAGYGKVPILHGVSLAVYPGEAVCLIGPNGAGKSTVLKAAIGLLRPTAGEIRFGGESVGGMRPDQLVRRGIGYVPQGRIVFKEMSVRENLEMGAFTVSDKARVRRTLDLVFGLFPRLAERPGQAAGTLSGGEQQMLAMARALMAEPRLVLLDEPSLGLAPRFVELVFAKLLELKATGLTLLLVEQNAVKALGVCDRGYVLELGRNRFTGTGAALLADERVRRLYLGG